jgi:methylmalonyl-CoA mutase
MLTAKDAETNILRSTIGVFAAAVGGANSISVLPHTLAHGLPNSEARRIARNTQLVLKDEASIGFVDDPSAGSGSIEQLTADLCAAAWAQFQLLESEGGLLRSLAANQFQRRVQHAAMARQRQYEAKERTIIGTTLFAQKDERMVEFLSATKPAVKLEAVVQCEAMTMRRIAEPFEGASA